MKKTLLSIVPILLVMISFTAGATVYTVTTTSNLTFSPTKLNVLVGDTIHWVWGTGVSHTTTSTTVPTGAATWDAPLNSTSPSFDYVITAVGDYVYHCSLHSGMTGSITVTSVNTGIQSTTSAETNLNFYPNPVRNNLNIAFNYATDGGGWLRIYDLTGKEIQTMQVAIASGANTLTIPMSNLTSGIYIAELFVGDKRIGVRRISKEYIAIVTVANTVTISANLNSGMYIAQLFVNEKQIGIRRILKVYRFILLFGFSLPLIK